MSVSEVLREYQQHQELAIQYLRSLPRRRITEITIVRTMERLSAPALRALLVAKGIEVPE